MADTYEELASEIDRIVNSPYPTQLKHLRDLLCTKCSARDVSRWILAKPCQVESLASCVLEGLRQWPYVLEIVEKLSGHIKIRDALLRLEPSLLHDLTLQAVKAGDAQSRYAAAAVDMLSTPLPKNIPMPADVQTLFVQMFDYAAKEPSVASIRPIHRILKGTGALLLGVLSSHVLLRFEQHLFDILRNIKGDHHFKGENHALSLYCLVIMKTIATASSDQTKLSTSYYDTQELLASTEVTSSKWTPDAVQQFFTEAKSQKTMQLIVLQAMWACTATTGQCLDGRMENLVLANEVIDAVPSDLRASWRKANVMVVRKLEDKALAPSLEMELRLQALCFILRLTDVGIRPALVTDSLRQILVGPATAKIGLRDSREGDLECLVNGGVLNHNTTAVLVQNIVDFATNASSVEIVESWEAQSLILRHLNTAMTHEEIIAEGTMLALDVLSCGQKLQHLAQLIERAHAGADDGSTASACHHTLRRARNGLTHQLCKVFLTAALSCRQSTYSVGQATLSLLLELHASSAEMTQPCSHVRNAARVAHPTQPIMETGSTPADAPLDWRQALGSHFKSRARYEHEQIAAVFAKACGELEARCEDVEKPLRESHEERNALQRQYDELNQAYANLESEGIDRNIRVNALETERDQCMGDLDAARVEAESLVRRVEELELSLQAARASAQEAVEEARRASESAEMQHDAAMARKEEQLEDLQAQLHTSADDLNATTEELHRLKKDLRDAGFAVETANNEAHRLRTVSNEQQASIQELKTANDGATERRKHLEAELQSVRGEMSAALQAQQAKLGQIEEQARQNLAAAAESNGQKLAEMATMHNETCEKLTLELSELRNEYHREHEHHAVEIERRDIDLADKQKKIDRLNRKCEQKDNQIAEASAMRNNLMAAMGLNGVQTQAKLALRPPRTSSAQTQQRDTDSQDDPSPPTPFSGDDVDTQQPDAKISFASSNASSAESRSGPTPKRPRARRAFKVPSPAKPRLSNTLTTRSARPSTVSQSTSKRQPLLSVSGNRLQRGGAAPKTPSNSAGKMMLDDVDESTFDGSELFAGTPGERMLDLEGAFDENTQSRL
ncbi:hypothetical protein LTR37_012260 [Vermiconidia calcicola]|uniref:Uncharacterized protein n=1 Tax=Vermiconidia calcicola TaxID=1690605 RepID=A0ACC3N014_9PEZI|nr:hypothetical protein LTR37_012260 [Vermiconidia calcicola]